MPELQHLKQDGVAEYIEEVLRTQTDGILPCAKTILKTIELPNLRSKQELLKESLAVEKERIRAGVSEVRGESDEINQVISSLSAISFTCFFPGLKNPSPLITSRKQVTEFQGKIN